MKFNGWTDSPFGEFADFELPAGCNAIVVSVNGGEINGAMPVRILLPHQLYRDEARELLEEHGATEIIVSPLMQDSSYQIAGADIADAKE